MNEHGGKIDAIRRELDGRACPFCGSDKYHLVLRSDVSLNLAPSMPIVQGATALVGWMKPRLMLWVEDKFCGTLYPATSG